MYLAAELLIPTRGKWHCTVLITVRLWVHHHLLTIGSQYNLTITLQEAHLFTACHQRLSVGRVYPEACVYLVLMRMMTMKCMRMTAEEEVVLFSELLLPFL